jgi:D-galactarolactone cycloisomerase
MFPRGLRRRDFLKGLSALAAAPLLTNIKALAAGPIKVTEVRIQPIKLEKDVGSFKDYIGRTLSYRIGGGNCIEIYTDQGLVGIGPDVEPSALKSISAILVGQDPFDVDLLGERLSEITVGSVGFNRPGASAEIALWDLIGKATGQPLYKLWGGSKHKITPYSSMFLLSTPEERAETAVRLKSEGWRAVKFKAHYPTQKDDIALVTLTRKAVGDNFDIMVDANKAGLNFASAHGVPWDFTRAYSTAMAYQELGVYWLEEPLPRYDFEELAELNRLLAMKLAGGELNHGLHEFRWLLEQGCFDVIQPEVMSEGPNLLRKVAVIADSMNKLIVPHLGDGRLGTICNMHLSATWPNAPYLECSNENSPGEYTSGYAMFENPIVLTKDGHFDLPQGPGLGMTIRKELLVKSDSIGA